MFKGRRSNSCKGCHGLAELTSTSTDGGFHGRGIEEQLFRRRCDRDFLPRPEIIKKLQSGGFCASVRKAIRTGDTAERSPGELTGPSRRSRRRRGLVARPPSLARGAWCCLPRPLPCRPSPAPACGSRSRPAAAPSAAPAQTSGGLRPRRVHCQWKTWRKGSSTQRTWSLVPAVAGNLTRLQVVIHKRKANKHPITPPCDTVSSSCFEYTKCF